MSNRLLTSGKSDKVRKNNNLVCTAPGLDSNSRSTLVCHMVMYSTAIILYINFNAVKDVEVYSYSKNLPCHGHVFSDE